MAQHSDGYSRAVSWLKVVLPIVGLGILSTLFLVARETRVEQRQFPPEATAPDGGFETVREPAYSGVTGDGAAVSILAENAWPAADESGEFEGTGILARFEMANGDETDIRAEAGTLMPGTDMLSLRGDVRVATASGWTVQSETLTASLDWTRFTSPVRVHTEGPLGTLDADRMVITRRENDDDGGYLMEFDGDVHLVYLP